jgi:hypothetical protein
MNYASILTDFFRHPAEQQHVIEIDESFGRSGAEAEVDWKLSCAHDHSYYPAIIGLRAAKYSGANASLPASDGFNFQITR